MSNGNWKDSNIYLLILGTFPWLLFRWRNNRNVPQGAFQKLSTHIPETVSVKCYLSCHVTNTNSNLRNTNLVNVSVNMFLSGQWHTTVPGPLAEIVHTKHHFLTGLFARNSYIGNTTMWMLNTTFVFWGNWRQAWHAMITAWLPPKSRDQMSCQASTPPNLKWCAPCMK